MAKQILPRELAEIVSTLLTKPEACGELDTADKFNAFFLDIGRVVADHCGGEANWVNPASVYPPEEGDDDSFPMLSVSPNDSLPSLENNVWAKYDEDGWEDETDEASQQTAAA